MLILHVDDLASYPVEDRDGHVCDMEIGTHGENLHPGSATPLGVVILRCFAKVIIMGAVILLLIRLFMALGVVILLLPRLASGRALGVVMALPRLASSRALGVVIVLPGLASGRALGVVIVLPRLASGSTTLGVVILHGLARALGLCSLHLVVFTAGLARARSVPGFAARAFKFALLVIFTVLLPRTALLAFFITPSHAVVEHKVNGR